MLNTSDISLDIFLLAISSNCLNFSVKNMRSLFKNFVRTLLLPVEDSLGANQLYSFFISFEYSR